MSKKFKILSLYVLLATMISIFFCMTDAQYHSLLSFNYGLLIECIIAFIITMFVVVGFHEFGHYLVGRLTGVTVLEFSIGFGPSIIKHISKKTGIEYHLSAIPFGGYVKFLTGMSEKKDGQSRLSFDDASPWKKIAIVLAGPLFNAVLAFVVFFVIAAMGTVHLKSFVGDTQPGQWAEKQGFMPGDLVVSIDDYDVKDFGQMFETIMANSGKESLSIMIEREGKKQVVETDLSSIKLSRESPEIKNLLGFIIARDALTSNILSIGSNSGAHKLGLKEGDKILALNDTPSLTKARIDALLKRHSGETIKVTYSRNDVEKVTYGILDTSDGIVFRGYLKEEYLGSNRGTILGMLQSSFDRLLIGSFSGASGLEGVVTSKISTDALSGPVGIATVAGSYMSYGLTPFLHFIASISISLMIINLLPIPAFDGFYAVLYSLEMITKKRMPEKIVNKLIVIGLVAIAGIFALVMFNDISGLIKG